MNRAHTLFHLREALEELSRTICEMETDPEYGEAEFSVAMTHLYHHINTAWNARSASKQETEITSDEAFHAWQAFPNDIDLGD